MNEQTGQTDPVADSALRPTFGFLKLSERRRRQLMVVFAASLAVHAVGLLAFGGWVVMRNRAAPPATFETPPPVRTYEPRQLEHRVKLQNRQRSSSRPAPVPRVVAMKPTALALPDVRMDPKLVQATFQPRFTPVSGRGLGAGLGTGYGTHGFGDGMPAYDFFGIRARGEKIAICVDVSVSMVEPERGGPDGYEAVKQRLGQVVDALSDAALFTVIVFADAASTMAPDLLLASDDNRRRAKEFLRPFNVEGQWGHANGNVQAEDAGVPSAGGTTRLDLALTAAFRMGADTIFVISDGMPRVVKPLGAEQLEGHREAVENWQRTHEAELRAWDKRWGGGGGVISREWIEDRRPERDGPPREGEAPAAGGHWEVRYAPGYHPRPQPPAAPSPGLWTLADFVQHLNGLYEKYYRPQGRPMPQIHAIGYAIDSDGHGFLMRLSRQFKGQYRRVARIR
jgi:hypothetical protein